MQWIFNQLSHSPSEVHHLTYFINILSCNFFVSIFVLRIEYWKKNPEMFLKAQIFCTNLSTEQSNTFLTNISWTHMNSCGSYSLLFSFLKEDFKKKLKDYIHYTYYSILYILNCNKKAFSFRNMMYVHLIQTTSKKWEIN